MAREGNLDAPTRHALDWQNPEFYDEEDALQGDWNACSTSATVAAAASACASPFPTLFDLVDESPTMEVDGVKKEDYWKVVDHCYLCDLCYMTKCPYVPPHEWNLDFPHLMLRAKAVHFQKGDTKTARQGADQHRRGRQLLPAFRSSRQTVNAANKIGAARKAAGSGGRHPPDARLPEFSQQDPAQPLARAVGRHAGRSRRPDHRQGGAVRHLLHEPQRTRPGRRPGRRVRAQRHPVTIAEKERCCGMPKLELGDLEVGARGQGSATFPCWPSWSMKAGTSPR